MTRATRAHDDGIPVFSRILRSNTSDVDTGIAHTCTYRVDNTGTIEQPPFVRCVQVVDDWSLWTSVKGKSSIDFGWLPSRQKTWEKDEPKALLCQTTSCISCSWSMMLEEVLFNNTKATWSKYTILAYSHSSSGSSDSCLLLYRETSLEDPINLC